MWLEDRTFPSKERTDPASPVFSTRHILKTSSLPRTKGSAYIKSSRTPPFLQRTTCTQHCPQGECENRTSRAGTEGSDVTERASGMCSDTAEQRLRSADRANLGMLRQAKAAEPPQTRPAGQHVGVTAAKTMAESPCHLEPTELSPRMGNEPQFLPRNCWRASICPLLAGQTGQQLLLAEESLKDVPGLRRSTQTLPHRWRFRVGWSQTQAPEFHLRAALPTHSDLNPRACCHAKKNTLGEGLDTHSPPFSRSCSLGFPSNPTR